MMSGLYSAGSYMGWIEKRNGEREIFLIPVDGMIERCTWLFVDAWR